MDNKNLKHLMEQAWPVPAMPTGSRERFASKLSKSPHNSARHNWWLWGTGASVGIVAAILALIFLVQTPSTTSIEDNKILVALSMNPEIAEQYYYYKDQMWKETENILKLSEGMRPDLRAQLVTEINMLNESPDSITLDIMNEEIDNAQKVIYITSVYRQHLRSLQYIHNILSENYQTFLDTPQGSQMMFKEL